MSTLRFYWLVNWNNLLSQACQRYADVIFVSLANF